jgi:hypothetical protein
MGPEAARREPTARRAVGGEPGGGQGYLPARRCQRVAFSTPLPMSWTPDAPDEGRLTQLWQSLKAKVVPSVVAGVAVKALTEFPEVLQAIQ